MIAIPNRLCLNIMNIIINSPLALLAKGRSVIQITKKQWDTYGSINNT